MTTGTVDQDVLDFLRIFTERGIQRKLYSFASASRIALENCPVWYRTASQNRDRTFIDAQFLIRYHQVNIKFHLISKAQTLGAGTKRIIKRKLLGSISSILIPQSGQEKLWLKFRSFPSMVSTTRRPIRQIQHSLNRIRKTFLNSRFHDKTVHNDLNVMFDILIQADILGKLIKISIDLNSYISASSGLIQKLCMWFPSGHVLPVPEAGSSVVPEAS